MADEQAKDPRSGLLTWAADQDQWIRWIIAKVAATGMQLQEAQLVEALNRLLAEKGLVENDFSPVPTADGSDVVAASAEPLELVSLTDSVGVNAIAPGQAITFNPKMTVLYGENASGKSGYVRILKRMASGRSEEPLLPNVHSAGDETPAAKITYRLGGEEDTLEWHGEGGVPPLTRVAVLDTRAMALHLDEDLTYVFTPADLALFTLAYAAIEAVRDRAETMAADRKPRTNPFTARFERGREVYREIEALGPSTDLGVIAALAETPPDLEDELQRRRLRVEALRPETLAGSLELARNDRELYTALISTCDAVEAFDAEGYAGAREREREASTQFSRVTSTALRGQIERVPAEAEAFVCAGEKVLETAGLEPYPVQGSHCIYCEQALDAGGAEVVAARRAWVNDESALARDGARGEAESAARELTQIQIEPPADRVGAKVASMPEPAPVLLAAAALISVVREAIAAVESGSVFEFATMKPIALELVPLARNQLASADEVLAALRAKESERRDAFEKERRELVELEAAATLAGCLDEVRSFVERARWADRLTTVLKPLRGVLRSLTEAGKIASESVLNQGFADQFAAEAKALNAPSVTLEFPGARGKAARHKALVPQHRLSEILSEGEQRVIALADFLAEASLRVAVAPFIFDDPVNSLDYKRLEHVVKRLVELSQHQQVIVFTHNVLFAFQILGHFEKAPGDCSYYDVRRGDAATGLVTGGTHPRTDTVKHLKGEINTLVQDAGTMTGESQAAVIERAYDKIRSWCEVVAEEDLLQGVTKRLQPNVQMTKLPQIRGDRLAAAIGPIMEMFEKACRVMGGHSQPLETLAVRPSIDELRKDWEAVQAARQAYLD